MAEDRWDEAATRNKSVDDEHVPNSNAFAR